MRHLPYNDQNKELVLQVDASKRCLGAALIQEKGPIAFASKSLTETEACYSNLEQEMLGIVWGLEKFHHYVFGHLIKVQTDHKPLVSITRKKSCQCNTITFSPHTVLIRTQPYDTDVEYLPERVLNIAFLLCPVLCHVNNTFGQKGCYRS